MNHINILIKPASALCNLRCSYCFYADITDHRQVRSFGKMKKEVVEKLISNVYADLNDGDELTVAFQGGEPTIAGLAYFKDFVARINAQAKKVKVNYALQTNGTYLNEKWVDFLKENNFLVGLSIDGGKDFHDAYRLDDRGEGTFARIMKAKHLLDEKKVDYNILCVLTQLAAKHPQKIWNFIVKEDIRFIQFIPCLDELDGSQQKYAITPESFAKFYEQLFVPWARELERGNYYSIKYFDDLYNLLVNRQVGACGLVGNCQMQYVIEADGSVYPCDFYCLDEYRVGYITEMTLKELFEQPLTMTFLHEKKELPAYCDTCAFRQICNGGCKRMKESCYVNAAETMCGHQRILQKMFDFVQSQKVYPTAKS